MKMLSVTLNMEFAVGTTPVTFGIVVSMKKVKLFAANAPKLSVSKDWQFQR